MYSDLFLYDFLPCRQRQAHNIPTSIFVIIGIMPAVIILIIAVTITVIIGLIYREKHRKHKLRYKTQVINNSHKEEEQQIELSHKEN